MLHSVVLMASDQVLARGIIGGTISWIVGVIGGFIAAVICGVIAAAKGRSAIGWGILGFFFSILTLIVVIVIPSKKG